MTAPNPNPNSQEKLSAEILADARRESEAITQRARQEADAVLAKARADADRARSERLDKAKAEAARRAELILATVPVEAGRRRLERLESLLESVHEKIRQWLQTREGIDTREMMVVLAVEAIGRMDGDTFTLKLAAGDHQKFGRGLTSEITWRAGRTPLNVTLVADPAITGGGLIVQDAAGRQVWDNRLPARLARLWPELRRQIALGAGLVGQPETTGGAA